MQLLGAAGIRTPATELRGGNGCRSRLGRRSQSRSGSEFGGSTGTATRRSAGTQGHVLPQGPGQRLRLENPAGFCSGSHVHRLGKTRCRRALDIARLNMVEFAYGLTGHNEITGNVRNPWNLDYITGGSSSGPAAAVAAGLVYGTLGSDTGGSIRFPASCCGLVGMKPTYGRVSRYGAMPLLHTLDHVGPLTRTVRDCALITQAIAGARP